MEEQTKYLYLCDGLACGPFCPNDMCKHTTKREHAKNGVDGCYKQIIYNNTVYRWQYKNTEDLSF